jgi:ATP-dependent DNA helicase RecG
MPEQIHGETFIRPWSLTFSERLAVAPSKVWQRNRMEHSKTRYALDTPLRELQWIAVPRVRALERLGLVTVGNLLQHYPRRYEDRTRFDQFPTGESDEAVCVCGRVAKTQLRRIRGRMRIFDAVLEEANSHALSAPLVCRWFNSPWVEKMILNGQRLVVHGKPKRSGANIVIAHPEFEAIDDDGEISVHLNRIAPIHGATEGITPRVMRRLVWDILERLDDSSVAPVMPRTLDRQPRSWALRQIHFPESEEALAKARQHLVLEEFFIMQLAVSGRRAELSHQPGAAHCGPGELMKRLHQSLPFPLTLAQHRAIHEIRGDLAAPRPMNRLLHGDVGSGKTLVALSAMLLCVESGHQTALMAPTQILAEQHYLNLRRLCDPLGIRVALRTGARKEESGDLPLFQTTGQIVTARATSPETRPLDTAPHIFVGTHALLYENAGITNLGLAVIDEQHKFGVVQRARLRDQGIVPDVLVMTATPIPRTLTMTVYGDLDISTLDELPKGRGRIGTAVRDEEKLPEAVKFMREHLEAGRQAYIVYPLIDESEKLEAKAAAAEFSKWQDLLAPMKCELLHGRVLPEEKDAIMERFRRGETKALIATTVIEVGIDVPNASIMLIENGERFGLAQLHQLRGRIGRGEHKSYCIVLQGRKADESAREKLAIFGRTIDGFEIAEEDLRIRGPGDILGTAQSGLPPLKIGDVFKDADLMKLARNAAYLVFERDPNLQQPEHAHLRELVASGRAVFSQVS